ncbi:MAG TPA: phospho-sugar mutase [Bacteroidales bacterium]|nr:phospho-sugar mutase [Bacteroidales bacterium]HRZ48676.1 phospho-sugar mutase [Bacteroidales bacterium]
MDTLHIDPAIIEKAKRWTTEVFDPETRSAVQAMLNNPGEELVDAFYQDLEFGTGGMRGIMGPGTNRMNRYTIGMSTQGLANYLKMNFPGKSLKVAIAYDCRNNSPEFARICANVLTGNGMEVLLFESLRPTPELSFAIMHYGCTSGIMITASHNPKEYNGFKVYWNDGAQLVPPHDVKVVEHARSIRSVEEVIWEGDAARVRILGHETDKAYIDMVCSLGLVSRAMMEQYGDMPVVYSPLHGTGTRIAPEALRAFGFKNIYTVASQSVPDGNFPTVVSPNPEEGEALTLAIALAEEKGADLVLATDPDSDRVGIAIRDNSGKFRLMNGNQTAVIILYYLLEQWKSNGKLNGKQYLVKTIVTTYLIDKIAEYYGVECFNVLTGFKYIAEVIRDLEGVKQYIAGGEESYGLMIGDQVRDKDAISACCIIAEAAIWARSRSMTLYQMLQSVHAKFGLFQEHLISITKKGKSGADEIKAMMERFRNQPPDKLAGAAVAEVRDFRTGIITSIATGASRPTGLASSNVLQLQLSDGSLITMRPSGTEPKIKFYFSVNGTWNQQTESYEDAVARLKDYIKQIIKDLNI